MRASQIEPGKSVDMWKVFRDACDARSVLGLRDRALAVLNALLTFLSRVGFERRKQSDCFSIECPADDSGERDRWLNLARTSRISLRQALSNVVTAPMGSAMREREPMELLRQLTASAFHPFLHALKNSLSWLSSCGDPAHVKIVKERITIARRDVRKLISAAVEDGVPGNWGAVETLYVALMARLRTAKTTEVFEEVLEELELLREEVINQLEILVNSEKTDTNDADIRQHTQNSNTESIIELEPSSGKEQGAKSSSKIEPKREPIKAFPLSMVLRACPDIAMYGPGGSVESWRDLMVAAVVVRSMLGVSPSAYEDACEVMGPENAAATMQQFLKERAISHRPAAI